MIFENGKLVRNTITNEEGRITERVSGSYHVRVSKSQSTWDLGDYEAIWPDEVVEESDNLLLNM